MREILPGVFHWTAEHPRLRADVSSYYLAAARTLLDPMVPPEAGLGWFRDGRPVDRIVLTNRHHDRESARFVEAFGITVLVPEAGLHEFQGNELEVEPYRPGDEVAPGVLVHEGGAICADDMILEVRDVRALAMADGVIREDGFGFVPDRYMADPERDKHAIVDSLRRILDLDFDAVLVAHGEPQPRGAKEELRRFVEEFEVRR